MDKENQELHNLIDNCYAVLAFIYDKPSGIIWMTQDNDKAIELIKTLPDFLVRTPEVLCLMEASVRRARMQIAIEGKKQPPTLNIYDNESEDMRSQN
jgi:hypothetical protein